MFNLLRWSELQVWPQEAFVKHVKGLFKAVGYNNAAEPGNGSHSRFYVSCDPYTQSLSVTLGASSLIIDVLRQYAVIASNG